MNEKSALRALFAPSPAGVLGHGLDGLGQSVLASRREILVHDPLVRDTVDHRLLELEFLERRRLVARGDRLLHVLDRAAQRRFEARVVLAPRFALTGALASLRSVGHLQKPSLPGVGKKDRA